MKKALLLGAGVAATAITAARIRRSATRFDLQGKTVVVTGGGRGLGLQIAREAARRGAKLGLLARSPIELAAAQEELIAEGAAVAIAVCDVREPVAVGEAMTRFASELGPVDVLVNVAGVISVGPVGALTIDDYRDAVETNLFGAIHCVEAVRASMQERGTGRIVNIASLGGRIAIPHMLPYSASKFAVLGYSEGLRAELLRDGIRVLTVIPGLMRTGSPPRATFAGQPEKEYVPFVLSDSLPLLSIDVGRAARIILNACERGEGEVIVGWQAKLATRAYALAPRAIVGLLGAVNRFLPKPGSGEHRPGYAGESPLTESFLTTLGRNATETQHELLDPVTR